MENSRLKKMYTETLRLQLLADLKLKNIMEVPRLSKIVVNVGVKEAVADSRALQLAAKTLEGITGQLPVRTLAKKSIAGFKVREGMPIGVMVTLRKERMYNFFDKLIHLALPKVRDFHGVSSKLDGQGNYNLGIKDWTIFPEADSIGSEKSWGMNITFHTTARVDAHAFELLKGFGMPFKKQGNNEKN